MLAVLLKEVHFLFYAISKQNRQKMISMTEVSRENITKF